MTFRLQVHASSPERVAEHASERSGAIAWTPGTPFLTVTHSSRERALVHATLMACAIIERELPGIRLDGITAT